jgi:membrane-anchored glycerophosphoryl diester phosphodiesterase (GDPDase)
VTTIDDFNIGSVLGQSWSLFKKNFISFGLTSILLLAVPIVLLMGLAMPVMMKGGAIWVAQLPSLLQLFFQMVLMGAITYGTYAALDGKTPSLQDLVSRGLSGVLPLLGITVIFILVMIPSAFLLMIPFIILACMWWVAVPAAIVEKAGVIGSLKRSAELTKGARMKIFGLILLYVLLSLVVGLISLLFLSGGGFSLSAITQGSMAMLTGGFSLFMIFSQALGALMFAFVCVVIAVCYAELRRIKDGVSVRDVAHIFS